MCLYIYRAKDIKEVKETKMGYKQKVQALPVGEIMWCTIDGDGIARDAEGKIYTDKSTAPESVDRWKRECAVRYKKDSKEAKAVVAMLDAAWEEYKEVESGIKSATQPNSLGYKIETKENKETGAKEETGYIIVSASTNSYFPNGDKSVVGLADEQGNELSPDEVLIGNETTGRMYVEIAGYFHKISGYGITMYLKKVQVVKDTIKEKSMGDTVEVEAIEGYTAPAEDETPEI